MQEIKKSYGGLGHHYGGERGCGYENFSVQIIDQVEERDKVASAEKEVYWQNQLGCYVQNGGHAHCYRKEKLPPSLDPPPTVTMSSLSNFNSVWKHL